MPAVHASQLQTIKGSTSVGMPRGAPLVFELLLDVAAVFVFEAAEDHDARMTMPRLRILIVREQYVHNVHPQPDTCQTPSRFSCQTGATLKDNFKVQMPDRYNLDRQPQDSDVR